MATELLKELEQEAQCGVCLDTVNDPKTLSCLHSFCLTCLENLRRIRKEYDDDEEEPLSPEDTAIMACPVCRMYGEIPDDLADLPTSFHINRLVDILALKRASTGTKPCNNCKENNIATCYCFVCLEFACSACFEVHHCTERTTQHRNALIENFQANHSLDSIHPPVLCSRNQHDNKQPLKYYCQECQVCVCQDCYEASHDMHKMIDISVQETVEVMHMRSVIEKAKLQVLVYQTRMNNQSVLIEKSKEENVAAQNKVTKTVENLISVLKEHEKAMKSQLQEVNEAQQKDYATQLDKFKLRVSQLKTFVKCGEAILEKKHSTEIFQARRGFEKQGEELFNLKKVDLYYPHHVEYMMLRQAMVDIKGYVVVKYADALKSEVDGKGLKEADVGSETNFTVTVRDQENKQFYNEYSQITADVINPQGEYLKKEIKDHKNGKYTFTYTPQIESIHTVEIYVNGKALAGSPWRLQVMPHHYRSVVTFGTSGDKQGQFDWPVSVAVSKSTENIAIADCDNKRIQLFNSKGEYLREFGQNGAEKLNQPKSVAFTSSGNIIVLDSSKIFHFDENGQLINVTTNKQLINPSSLTVGHDVLIVCDKGDKTIKVLSPKGTKLLNSFRAHDCTTSPDFAVFHQNKIFVSFFEANCVKVFDIQGYYLFDIGKGELESDNGQSVGPLGLAVDSFEHLVVCYLHSKELYRFTLDGKFIGKIDVQEPPDKTMAPYSVAASNEGHVIMVDLLQHSVTIFQ